MITMLTLILIVAMGLKIGSILLIPVLDVVIAGLIIWLIFRKKKSNSRE